MDGDQSIVGENRATRTACQRQTVADRDLVSQCTAEFRDRVVYLHRPLPPVGCWRDRSWRTPAAFWSTRSRQYIINDHPPTNGKSSTSNGHGNDDDDDRTDSSSSSSSIGDLGDHPLIVASEVFARSVRGCLGWEDDRKNGPAPLLGAAAASAAQQPRRQVMRELATLLSETVSGGTPFNAVYPTRASSRSAWYAYCVRNEHTYTGPDDYTRELAALSVLISFMYSSPVPNVNTVDGLCGDETDLDSEPYMLESGGSRHHPDTVDHDLSYAVNGRITHDNNWCVDGRGNRELRETDPYGLNIRYAPLSPLARAIKIGSMARVKAFLWLPEQYGLDIDRPVPEPERNDDDPLAVLSSGDYTDINGVSIVHPIHWSLALYQDNMAARMIRQCHDPSGGPAGMGRYRRWSFLIAAILNVQWDAVTACLERTDSGVDLWCREEIDDQNSYMEMMQHVAIDQSERRSAPELIALAVQHDCPHTPLGILTTLQTAEKKHLEFARALAATLSDTATHGIHEIAEIALSFLFTLPPSFYTPKPKPPLPAPLQPPPAPGSSSST